MMPKTVQQKKVGLNLPNEVTPKYLIGENNLVYLPLLNILHMIVTKNSALDQDIKIFKVFGGPQPLKLVKDFDNE